MSRGGLLQGGGQHLSDLVGLLGTDQLRAQVLELQAACSASRKAHFETRVKLAARESAWAEAKEERRTEAAATKNALTDAREQLGAQKTALANAEAALKSFEESLRDPKVRAEIRKICAQLWRRCSSNEIS